MEEIKINVTCKELGGNVSRAVATFSPSNQVTFVTSEEGPSVSVGQIVSDQAEAGQVISANGTGGAEWRSLDDVLDNLIILDSPTGTLSVGDLQLAQKDVAYIKLTQGDNISYFRKYLETATMIYFTYASLGTEADGAAQVSRQHIDVTIATRAYALSDGELIETYNKEQIDSAFDEITVQEE